MEVSISIRRRINLSFLQGLLHELLLLQLLMLDARGKAGKDSLNTRNERVVGLDAGEDFCGKCFRWLRDLIVLVLKDCENTSADIWELKGSEFIEYHNAVVMAIRVDAVAAGVNITRLSESVFNEANDCFVQWEILWCECEFSLRRSSSGLRGMLARARRGWRVLMIGDGMRVIFVDVFDLHVAVIDFGVIHRRSRGLSDFEWVQEREENDFDVS